MLNETPCVRIGFLPTYRFAYGDWCARMHAESVAALKRVEGIQLIELPAAETAEVSAPDATAIPHAAVHTLDEAEAAAAFFRQSLVDGLVICPLDFGDERSVAKVLEHLRVPALLYAIKEPPASTGPSLARVSDSYCGTLTIAAALHRRHLQFHFAGLLFPDEPALQEAFTTFASAASVLAGLRNARVGQVGVRPAPFESVTCDETALITKFGQNVIYRSAADILAQAENYDDSDPALTRIQKQMRDAVATATVPHTYFAKASRLQAALSEFWTCEKLSTMAVQCWPTIHQRVGIEPCAVFAGLTGRGMLTACEADVLGALSMLVSYRAAMRQAAPHLIDWTIRHRDNPNQLLAWHCGNAPVCLAANPRTVALRTRDDMQGSLGIRADSRGGLLQFRLRPGEVTFCRLAEYDDRWKMLIATGRVVPSDETLAGTWSWVEVPDHDRLYRTLIEEGFVHHASMAYGNQVEALKAACALMDVTPVVVD